MEAGKHTLSYESFFRGAELSHYAYIYIYIQDD